MNDDATATRAQTLEDVARVAGVSRATVSRVINGVRNVDPRIQAAVRQAIDTTGYAPNRAARSLVTRRSGAIALVVCGAGESGEIFTDPFFGRIVSGVLNFLRPRGVHPVLMLAESDESRAEVVGYLRHGNADGALLVSTRPHDPLPGRLVEAGQPAVLFAAPDAGTPISHVDLAHREGGRLAAAHLLSRGRRRLATISGPPDVPASNERVAGFREAAAEVGEIPNADGNFTLHSGAVAMSALLERDTGVDGVFAANDLMAQGALTVLRERGVAVPGDIAVIGFDDSSAAAASLPALTTVRQPVEEMAAEMARLLLEQIEQTHRRVTSVMFRPTLVVRDST